ncbi:LAMB1 protein, partial [Crypturellus soui]|nr:LAMB1 protein [Crypturellus soui]
GRPASWTGTGFARVVEGSSVEFHVANVPFSMEYDVVIRYEPQVSPARRGHAVLPSEGCGRPAAPASLLPPRRYVVLPQPVCLEQGVPYTLRLELGCAAGRQEPPAASVLIDSLVLLPRYSSLEMFIAGDPSAMGRRETFERYRCGQHFHAAGLPPVAEPCSGLLSSLSAILHDGALPCRCDPQGSLSAECRPQGGQCRCKANVMGRRCHRCYPGTFGFGPAGCRACQCSSEGSVSSVCDSATGQCMCREGAHGLRCDRCQPGHWGFPSCRPCQCNGHAEECDARTGACLRCRDHTAGRHCERCQDGYYGDPVLGSGQQCRPCPCPGVPGTRHYHGSACHADRDTGHIVCLCAPGYDGE